MEVDVLEFLNIRFTLKCVRAYVCVGGGSRFSCCVLWLIFGPILDDDLWAQLAHLNFILHKKDQRVAASSYQETVKQMVHNTSIFCLSYFICQSYYIILY